MAEGGYPSAGKPRRWAGKDTSAVAGGEAKDTDASKDREVRLAGGAKEDSLPPRSGPPRQFPRPQTGGQGPASGSIRSVCVVGGGPSGLGCCRVLCDAGLEVTLVQESRGLGGKLCTKFVNGKEDPTLHFDMGVQLLRPAGQFAQELEGVIAPWPLPGRFKLLRTSGGWNGWKFTEESEIPVDGYVVGVPSMSAIGRHLAGQCKNLSVHIDRTAHVRGRDPKSGRWEVEWTRKAPTGTQLKYRPELAEDISSEACRGDFDAVVLAFEANKLTRGCKSGYKMVEPSATPAIRQKLSGGKTKTSQIWNLMVAFDEDLKMPWDAASVEGHRSIGWVAVNSSKPQRAKLPQCFQVFSTREWADWQQWGKRDVERELLVEVMDFLEKVLGRRPPKPVFVMAGRWGNNTESVLTGVPPKGEFPMRALGHEAAGKVVWEGSDRMGATGDWTRGFSVSDAFTAGQEMGEAVVKEASR
ncbi:unnamed protein product [Polarella glacialis]|uniref:Amine oxidase n=1 Tax=Polarella glacialis TaxID=89957 RepID=A0A813IFS8_POLGL|nr:unnamed protein product [Polarella glacialis]CAE8649835.1 unnamed protein product [Polarella glacialis]